MAWTRKDDLDGSPAEQVTLGWSGKAYTLDLGEVNREKLARLLQPYLTVATQYAPLPDAPEAFALPATPAVFTPALVGPAPGARRTNGKRPARVGGATASAGLQARDHKSIRAWANANGYDVSPKGRISDAIVKEYDQAQKVVATV